MRHADGRLITVIETYSLKLYIWQNEPKILNLFNAWRVLLKSGTARVTLRLPNRETARFFSTISAPRPATALDRIAQVVGDDRVVAYANLQT